MEEVVAAAPTGVNWFQLYVWKDRDVSMELVRRTNESGVKNLLLTTSSLVPITSSGTSANLWSSSLAM